MKHQLAGALVVALAAGFGGVSLSGQSGDTREAHIAAARAAAGPDHTAIFDLLCAPAADRPSGGAAPPSRSEWHADPAKVFDNLYFVGQTEYSAWAVTTSDGIILIDALFDYSVEDEVVDGLKKLGLDPAKIKYVIISHGHLDHAGGASYLQEHFAPHIISSAADWDLLEHDTGRWPKPKRDVVIKDGQTLTLGDTTLTFYVTPGHTLGTISTLIPVKDNGTPHLVAEWGGTAFNWMRSPGPYITPQRPAQFWFETYSRSAERFRDIVSMTGADAIIANHTTFDGTKKKLPALARRKPGDPNPYVIGSDSVKRYLTVADECAKAGWLGLK